MQDTASPYIGENDKLELSTGGYPNRDEAIARAAELMIEEEERAAIVGDGAPEDETENQATSTVEADEESGRPILLHPDEIRIDGGTQPRAALDMLVVADYAEAMKAGAVFPPIDVFYDGKDYWLADGFHRHRATIKADLDEILAIVHQGTQRDALLFSLGANETHGLRRSNDDKRRAVRTALEDDEWSKWSDSLIAEKLKVSQPFVSKFRRELTSQNVLSEQPARVGRDGVVRDTTHIGAGTDDVDDRQASFVGSGESVGAATGEPRQPIGFDEELTSPELKSWSPDDVAALLSRHGGVLMRMQLEEMGVSYAAIHSALSEGTIIQPETGKFTLPDHKPQPSGDPKREPAAATLSAPKPKPTVEELLKGRRLSVSFTWSPHLKGQVSVSVNMGDKPTDATRIVIASEKAPRFPEEVLVAIHDQLKDTRRDEHEAKKKPKVVKQAPAKPAKKSSKKPAKKAAKKKAPARRKK